MNPVLIEARNVCRTYDGGAVQALRGVDLTVRRGEFVSIMGRSGSGKSTLLNVLGALDNENAGTVTIEGVDLRHLPEPERFRARVIGFVFQSFHLLPTLTAVENVQIPMFEMPWPAAKRRQRAVELLAMLGLGERLHHLPAKLSGGERQRVAIARSLANEPPLLLADEPTGNLDTRTGEQVLTLLTRRCREYGTTLIMATHSPLTCRFSDRILRMVDGIVVEETPFWETHS